MKILIADKDDLEKILELQKDCYLEEAEIYNDYKIPPLTQTLESIKQDFEKETFIKIQFGDKIIGSVRGYLDTDTCKIGRLVVNKQFRNQGLGKKLMQAIESYFYNAERFELFTGNKSERNLSLYNKLGYTECDRKIINAKLVLVFFEKVNSNTNKSKPATNTV